MLTNIFRPDILAMYNLYNWQWSIYKITESKRCPHVWKWKRKLIEWI